MPTNLLSLSGQPLLRLGQPGLLLSVVPVDPVGYARLLTRDGLPLLLGDGSPLLIRVAVPLSVVPATPPAAPAVSGTDPATILTLL